MSPLSLQVVLLGLPRALRLLMLLAVPALAFVVRRKWRFAVARREEVRRLVLLASQEAARAEIEAANEYRSRLEYERFPTFSVSSTAAAAIATIPEPIAKPTCAVCFSPTTTRCSRCKVVRYCSGKCQIIHWRNGHKEECHPPKSDPQSDLRESTYVLRKQQSESYKLSGGNSGTLDANSGVTDIDEMNVSSNSSLAPTISNGEDMHSADDSVSKLSGYSSSFSSPSRDSSTLLTETVVSALNASAEDNSAKCSKDSAISGVSYILPSEMRQRKHSTSSWSECLDDASASRTASLDKLNKEGSGFCKEAVGCESDGSSGPSFRNGSPQSKYEDEDSGFGSEQNTGYTCSTNRGVAAEVVISHLTSDAATQIITKSYSSQVVPNISLPNKVDRDFLSKSSFLDSKDSSLEFLDVSVSRKENVELPPKPREGGSLSFPASVDKKSSGRNGHLDSSTPLEVVNTSSVHSKLSGMTNPAPNGSRDRKVSVQRVVQQFKTSKVSKNYKQMHLPYDIFVKLYNEKVEMRPSGLINCGNSCYANVVLQCLAFTRPLTSYLLQGLHAKSCSRKEWCFTCEFEQLVFKAKQGQSPLSPLSIISQIHNIGSHLGYGREEDAHEFLRHAIDAMQVICLKEAGVDSTTRFMEETTLIQLTFGGYLLSRIKCMRCLNKSERCEKMMDLTVEIDGDVGTLDEALTRFTMTEILDGENRYRCSRCKSYEKAKKQLKVLEAPNVLTIVLKRFQSGKFGKLNKTVKFPEFLNLTKYMSGTSDMTPTYRLYAVVVHLDIMNAAFSGHYVCYVMNTSGKWYKIDDSKVKLVEVDRVLSKSAYMLFYSRCSPRAPSLIRNIISHERGKTRGKQQDCLSLLGRSRLRNYYPDWRITADQVRPRSTWDSSESDSSSLFSCSDEGSCSTEGTRDSTSTDGVSSEGMLGESSQSNSPMRFPDEDHPDGFANSLFAGHHDGMAHGELTDSDSGSFQDDGFAIRGLSYASCAEEDAADSGQVSLRDEDGGSFLHPDLWTLIRESPFEYSRHRSSSRRRRPSISYPDAANPFKGKSILSTSSNGDRTPPTLR